jgi:hypothetical protein
MSTRPDTRAALLLSGLACFSCSTATDDLALPGAKVTFQLKNSTGAPLFLRKASLSPRNHWTGVADAKGVTVERTRPFCDPRCSETTAHCTTDQPPEIVELGPGGVLSEDWDGTAWIADDETGCAQPTQLESGRFQVSFCYGYARSGLDVERASCVVRTFDFAPGVVVEEIVAAPKPQDLRFVLANQTNRSIFVMNNLACSVAPGWLELEDRDGARLAIEDSFCECQCGRPCVPCAASCAAPQAVELVPGAKVEFIWDGFYSADVADQICTERRIAETEGLVATFCYGDGSPPDMFEEIPSPTCQRVPVSARAEVGIVRFEVR